MIDNISWPAFEEVASLEDKILLLYQHPIFLTKPLLSLYLYKPGATAEQANTSTRV